MNTEIAAVKEAARKMVRVWGIVLVIAAVAAVLVWSTPRLRVHVDGVTYEVQRVSP
jgi:hypothetical protein